MRNFKSKFNKKNLTSIFSFCLFILFSITLTFTSLAWFQDKKFAGGVIKFGDIGVEAIVKNLTSTSIGESGTSLSTTADFHLFIASYNNSLQENLYETPKELNKLFFDNVKQNDSLTILNPSITPYKNTTSYFLRSRWQIKVDSTEIDEAEWAEKANISSLPNFSSDWVKNNNFYYYVGSEIQSISNANDLKVNSYNEVSTGEVKFFDDMNLKVQIVDDEFDINIKEIEINLIFEVIEANIDYVNSEWFS